MGHDQLLFHLNTQLKYKFKEKNAFTGTYAMTID